jgi:hypothetical protein
MGFNQKSFKKVSLHSGLYRLKEKFGPPVKVDYWVGWQPNIIHSFAALKKPDQENSPWWMTLSPYFSLSSSTAF